MFRTVGLCILVTASSEESSTELKPWRIEGTHWFPRTQEQADLFQTRRTFTELSIRTHIVSLMPHSLLRLKTSTLTEFFQRTCESSSEPLHLEMFLYVAWFGFPYAVRGQSLFCLCTHYCMHKKLNGARFSAENLTWITLIIVLASLTFRNTKYNAQQWNHTCTYNIA